MSNTNWHEKNQAGQFSPAVAWGKAAKFDGVMALHYGFIPPRKNVFMAHGSVRDF